MSEIINKSELAEQLKTTLWDNAEKAAEMLITPLNLGVADLNSLKHEAPFNALPETSFAKARDLYKNMRTYFGDRIGIALTEAQDNHDKERNLARQVAMQKLGNLRNSVVYQWPLTDYLLENFHGQLDGVEKWSASFYKAFRSGKLDIRGSSFIAHLKAPQREAVARIYDKVYPFLLWQDFGADASTMNVYGYRKGRDIGRCLAYFCAQGIGDITPSMLSVPINGKSLSQLGIQDDVVKFAGENLYDHASLKKLNAFYKEFIDSNGQAQLVMNQVQDNRDKVAYQTLTPKAQLGDRPFQSSQKGETLAQFEVRQAQLQKEKEDRIRQKYT